MTTRSRPRIPAALNRAGWTFADQAVCSLGNVVITLLVARSVSAVAFGGYGLAFTTYVLVQGLSRALGSDPLVVRFASRPQKDVVAASGAALSAALLVGLVSTVVILGSVPLLPHGLRGIAVALALVLPALTLQDASRFVAVVHRKPRVALLNDAVWTLASASAVFLIARSGDPSPALLLAAWGATALLGAAVTLRMLGAPARLRAGWDWLTAHRDLSLPFTAQFLLTVGVGQLLVFAIALFGGLVSVAGVRAAQAVFGPVYVIVMGSTIAGLPELVRLSRRGTRPLLAGAAGITTALVVTAAGWGAVIHLVPGAVGLSLFGHSWRAAEPLILPVTLVAVGSAVVQGAAIAIRARGGAVNALRVQCVVAPVTVGLGLTGAVTDGARGALLGCFVANVVSAVLWWRQLLRPHRPEPGWSRDRG
jgi:O-antigen/teichoic acid export membrane protein